MLRSASTDLANSHRSLRRTRTPRVAHLGGTCVCAVLAGACVLWTGDASAQQPLCDDPATLAQSADTLRQSLERCQSSAPYLARMGHLYIQELRYSEAADHLERALLFEPDNAEIQLDYALALAGSGDVVSALNLVFSLQQRPDLPAPLRQSLRRVGEQWTLAAGDDAGKPQQITRFNAGLRAGYDSNLLGTPQLSSLTLTLPGEIISLPIDGSSQPKPGLYTRTDLRLEHTRLQPGGRRWELQAAVLHRNSPSVAEADSTQAEVQLEHALSADRAGGLGHYASAALTALQTRSGTRYISQGLAAGLEMAPASGAHSQSPQIPCTARLGLEWQNRQLQSNEVLSGRYIGVGSQWGCSLPSGQQWQLSARAGRDQPTNGNRPGGAQGQYSVRAYLRNPLGAHGAWLVDAEASHSRDAAGYSPLLDNGRRRAITRMTIRAEYQHTLALGVLALAGIEGVGQNASLPLFTLRSRGVYAGLRANW